MRVWVLPMAGKGRRVQELGECKPAIRVLGRPILGWCLSGLAPLISDRDTIVITTTRTFEKEYGLSALARSAIDRLELAASLNLVELEDVPPGPAASVYAAVDLFRGADETIVVNSDQFVQFRPPGEREEWDVFLPLYVNATGRSSYAEICDGRVTRIVEKRLISNYASAGIYGFRDGATLVRALEKAFESKPHHGDEYYVGPAINALIDEGAKVLPATVVAKYDLGSAPQIREFERVAAAMSGD